MVRACSIVLLLWVSGYSALAQTPDKALEYEIESLAEGNEENETDLVQLAERLELLRENPIALNFAEKEDLIHLPYLNIFQIHNLLEYRRETGLIYSKYELMVIKGFDRETIQKIVPYISFDLIPRVPELDLKKVWHYSRQNLLYRTIVPLQLRKGYTESSGYRGAPLSHYLRFRSTYRDLTSVNLTLQQDAGEPLGGPDQKRGVDFISGHVALQNYGPLRKLIMGDYQAEFGQGLALWTSLAFGKSAEPIEIKRYAAGLRPFSGAEENRFMRGVAATYRIKEGWDLSLFYSNHAVDASSSNADTVLDLPVVSTLQTTGLHRTESELASKNALQLQTSGGNLKYSGHQFSVGTTVVNHTLNIPLAKSDRLYQQFRFSGTSLNLVSVDFNYLLQDLNFFGEGALSQNGAWAGTFGFQSHPSDAFFLSVLYRHFQKDYQFIYNAPFAESGNYGERGFYLGMQWLLNSRFQFRSYLDIYRFDWLRFRADAPSTGRDLLAQLDLNLTHKFSVYLRYKNELQEINAPHDAILPMLAEQTRSSFRLHGTYQVSDRLRTASRLELSFFNFNGKPEEGHMIFQDLQYLLDPWPVTLTTRLALIATPGFNTRIYAYENDLTYAFSIPAYYGQSIRYYMVLDWDIQTRLTLQAKYAATSFSDREVIGSGLSQVRGSVLSEVRLQLIWKI